jgi:hypothetical protein
MALAERLKTSTKRHRNRPDRCSTCEWYEHLSPEAKAEFDAWVADDGNLAKLYRLCADVDAGETPIPVGLDMFRFHIRRCHHGST